MMNIMNEVKKEQWHLQYSEDKCLVEVVQLAECFVFLYFTQLFLRQVVALTLQSYQRHRI